MRALSVRLPACLLLVGIFFFVYPYGVAAASFSRTLLLGSQGSDVTALQHILNNDPYTQVATNGPGSPGQESAYFGVKTQVAVMNFQKKYAPEVLFPAGIWQPTGVVGSYTRAKLNTLSSANLSSSNSPSFLVPTAVQTAIPALTAPATSSVPTTTVASMALYNAFVTKSRPLLFNLSRYQAAHGQSVTVNGSGFLAVDNSVVFGAGLRVDGIQSTDGSTLSFTVPSSIPNGSYNLSIENKNGTTLDALYGNFFTISDSPMDPPTVTSITPKIVPYTLDAGITVSGGGFASTGNDVYSGLGTAMNVSSTDGHTIHIPLASFSRFANAGQYAGILAATHVSIPVFVAVKNQAGISTTSVTFLLQY